MAGSNHNDEAQWERPFAPADLDVLEDALELPAGREPAWPASMDEGMRAQIGGALRSYEAIGVHARRVLLAPDPPKHILDAVIAQARAEVVHPVMPDAPVVAPPRRWWSRPVAWLVPSFGAAIAAVAVFVVMQPREDEATVASAPAVQSAAKSEDKGAAAPPMLAMRDDDASGADGDRGAGLVVPPVTTSPRPADGFGEGEPSEEQAERRARNTESARAQTADKEKDDLARPSAGPIPGAGRGDANDPPSPASPPATKKPASRPGGSSTGGVGGSTPRAEPAEPASPSAPKSPQKSAPKPEPKPDAKKDAPPSLDDRLSQGDAARNRGDCQAARREYDAVIAAGSSRQRARARAGKALCLERGGQSDEARKLLDQARSEDPSVDDWVDAQR